MWKKTLHTGTVAACAVLAAVSGAWAQSLTGDAREVGLGGVDYAARILADPSGPPPSQFIVPIGLLQLLMDRKSLNWSSSSFDPSLVLEYSAEPTHWVFGRRPSPPRARFISDIRNARLSTDLNVYRGFKPAPSLEGGGRLSPSFGKTFTVRRSGRLTHQAYAGAGPYMTIQTTTLFDDRLVDVLGASSATFTPSSTLRIGNHSVGQAAAEITGGYRANVDLGGRGGTSRLELLADYNYLHGFRYEDVDLNLRLDTDARGLLALDVPGATPLAIDRLTSKSGRGSAVDLAATAIFDRWRVALRADGVGNHIDWTSMSTRGYEMARLVGGFDRLAIVGAGPAQDVRVSLPVELRLQGAYRDAAWGGVVELEDGIQGRTGSAGLERRFPSIELRGGARLVNGMVIPSGGASVRAGRVWVDMGAALSTANVEKDRNVVAAVSLRFGGGHATTPAERVASK